MVYRQYYIKFIILTIIFITTNWFKYLLYISINIESKFYYKDINEIYAKLNKVVI